MDRTLCQALKEPTTKILVLLAILLTTSVCTAQSFSATQQLVDFGDVAVNGVSGTQTVILVNYGDSATLIGVSIQARTGSPDGQFTITGGTCTTLTGPLQTTDRCTYTVQAKPTVSGTVSARITVTGYDPADGTSTSQPVIITANGVIPKLEMHPALDFGNVEIGTASGSQDVSLANIGAFPAVIDGATLSVASANPQFIPFGGSCLNTPPPTLAPGETCTITVRAIPNVAGMIVQQIVLQAGPGAAYAPVANSLTVNGVLSTLPPSPPAPAPHAHKHRSSPRRLLHHSTITKL